MKQDHHSEGFRWAMRILEQKQGASPELRTEAILFGSARLAYLVGQMKQVHKLLQEALAWARATESRYYEAWALGYLGLCREVAEGDRDQAVLLCQQALTLFRQVQADDHGLAWVLNSLGVLYALRGEYIESETCYEEALVISQPSENEWGIRMVLQNLGLVAYQQGHYDQAYQRFLELLPLTDQSNRLYELADLLCGVGLICAATGQTVAAVIILSGVDKLLADTALNLGHPESQLYKDCLANLRQAIDPAQFTQEWSQGQTLTIRDLVAYVKTQPSWG